MNANEYLELQPTGTLSKMLEGWAVPRGAALPGLTQQESSVFAAALRQQIMDVLHRRAIIEQAPRVQAKDARTAGELVKFALRCSALADSADIRNLRVQTRFMTGSNAFHVTVELADPERQADAVEAALRDACMDVDAGYAFMGSFISVFLPR